MILITGAAGFIGSCLSNRLVHEGYKDLLLVDDFSRSDKHKNLNALNHCRRTDREVFINSLPRETNDITFVFHIGARTDTTEMRQEVFEHLNLEYSKAIWNWCSMNQIPLVYASSAATYGDGELGYHDSIAPERLRPLNPYGRSKNDFDAWALDRPEAPPFWAGLKFFNVFGPNEYHKGRMASVIFHAFRQISDTGTLRLFRSHRPDYSDGGQMRDFIYVKDLLDVLLFMMLKKPGDGLYNLGTGKARSFRDLGEAVFSAMGRTPVIEYIDTPVDIRDKYQYYTQAEMGKLRSAGYEAPFTGLEDAVEDYVLNYLQKQANY